MKKKYVMGLAVIAVVTCMSTAQAMDTFMVGPRAMGMAGANVASVDNNSAQYYNPAAFGFFGRHNEDGSKTSADRNNLGRKHFGWDVYAGAGIDIKKDMGQYLDTLADIDIDNLSDNGIQNESDLQNIINLVTSLNGLDEPGNALMVDVNAGTSLRFKNFGIGLRGYSQVVGYVPFVDQDNLGLNLPDGLASEINSSVATTGIDYSGSAASFFTTVQYDNLLVALNNDVAAADKVAYYAAQQGVTPQQTDELITTLGKISAQSGSTNELDQNTTTVVLNGFAVAEVPLTYGYALNDNIAIGANLKLMKGRVYGTEVLVFNDGSEDVLERTDENYKETTTYGVDLGVMARYGMFNFGLTGRNLNSPKFDGFSKDINYDSADTDPITGLPTTITKTINVADIKLKPQATAGIAFIPFETLTLEVDYDLTKNETVLTKYKTQNLSAGLEWDIMRFLALRAGAYKNMAESDTGVVYTAGLGLNLWAIRLDIAGAMSPDKVQFDGEEVPKLAKASVQLSVDF